MSRAAFYSITTGLIILNGYLLSKPNLLGKIGLVIYKYHYLRTFPRTLLTVSVICGIAIVLSESIAFLVRSNRVSIGIGSAALVLLLTLAVAQLVVTGIDFSAWTYSHTGLRFRLGAFMLPTVVICILAYGLIKLPRPQVISTLDDVDRKKDSSPTNPGT